MKTRRFGSLKSKSLVHGFTISSFYFYSFPFLLLFLYIFFGLFYGLMVRLEVPSNQTNFCHEIKFLLFIFLCMIIKQIHFTRTTIVIYDNSYKAYNESTHQLIIL